MLGSDPNAKFNNGNVLDETIYTPGKIQQSTINLAGELKKSVNLTPFNLDPKGVSDEIQDPLFGPSHADDIIYGGWGNDFLHGGAGDDAISGAEALPEFYSKPFNPGNVLEYGKYKAGEFALYDEYDPLKKIEGFLLNFDATEGPNATGTKTDGNDVIFGDLGNDWIVGGTGRDHLYGGWGDDLLNADDNLDTNGGLNDAPDTDATYEDIAYGGAGRDVLIGNTGGDRLIDWVGEFNSYIVPFAPFGMATVSRTVQPQLPEYLYALSMSDGVDMTRTADTGNDPARNGEPDGELGLIRQKDSAWKDQTGAPADPQAGNLPGGKRDVLRSASFNTGSADMCAVDSGKWTVSSGRYQVEPEYKGGDALAVFNVDKYIPNYFEMLATIRAVKPIAGYNANAYLVFDYQSATDFKFAGINISTSKLEMGYRDATGWHVVVQAPYTGALKADTDYNVLLALNGNTATLVVENRVTLTYTFAPRVDMDGYQSFLNEGMVGIGANNAKGAIDNVVVQRIAPETTLEQTVEFSGDAGSLFTGEGWTEAEGRYAGENAVALTRMTIDPAYLLDLSATLQTDGQGGFVFDWYGPKDYKFVAVSVETGQVLIGHSTAKGGRVIDAAWNSGTLMNSSTDYSLNATLMGNTVSVTFNNMGVLSFAYNALVTDGQFGLLAHNGEASFDSFTVKTDDPSLGEPITPVFLPMVSVSDASVEEDSGTVTVTVTLSEASNGTVSVDYKTVDGTATAGNDYEYATNTLTFAAGETSKQLVFNIIDDDENEPDEVFSVQLFNAVGAAITDGTGTINIINDDFDEPDPPPAVDLTVSVSNVSVNEGVKTTKTSVTVTLSQAATETVYVRLFTEDGTAKVSDKDYVAADTILTFKPGETSKTYALSIIGDKVFEPDEWFRVTAQVLDDSGKVFSESTGTVMILNDDKAPLLAAETATGPQSQVELLTEEQLAPIVAEAIARWEAVLGAPIDLSGIDFQIMDFKGRGVGILGQTTPDMIYIDADAAGWGWFVDPTPQDDVEFSEPGGDDEGRMDLLTAVMHEIGHALGYGDLAGDADDLMSATLNTGERWTPGGDSLVVMDDSNLNDAEPPALAAKASANNSWLGELLETRSEAKHSWLREFLITRAQGERNPFEPTEDIKIVIVDEETEEV